MKNIILTAFMLTTGLAYGKRTDAELKALNYGASINVVLRVVDDKGAIVANAAVAGNLHMNDENGYPFNGRTDKNGIYTVNGKCVGDWHYFIKKNGYYDTFAEPRYFSPTNTAVSSGRWQPYGATNTVVLKRIINPIPMFAQFQAHDYSAFPAHNVFIGYDLEKCDWVEPHGKGTAVDFEVMLEETKIDINTVKDIMTVRFTNCLDGAYVQKKDKFSRYNSVYSADTNAAYAKDFVYVYDSLSTPAIDTRLSDNEYMVFRVRTEVDEDGNLVKAHYGKIYGVWQFIHGTMGLTSYLNPTPNDTNLEFNMNKNLAPKNSGYLP